MSGQPLSGPEIHNDHCFDALRQSVMCAADDTLRYSFGAGTSNIAHDRKCRDWDALRDWAATRTACYDDEPPVGSSPWGRCHGGSDGMFYE